MLLVATEGVPLIVHVLLSMDRPVGSAGETVHVAPVTLVKPPPEPLPPLSPVMLAGSKAHNSAPFVPSVAWKNKVVPRGMKPHAELPLPPLLMSCTNVVPEDVPSLCHNSRPVLPSSA